MDPFTSGGAYRPSYTNGASNGGGGGGGGGGGFEDPLSAKRYRPGNAPPPSSTTTAPASTASTTTSSAAFATFDTCKHDAVLGKLMQFNNEVGGGMALDEMNASRLVKVVDLLKSASSGAPGAGQVGVLLARLPRRAARGGADQRRRDGALPQDVHLPVEAQARRARAHLDVAKARHGGAHAWFKMPPALLHDSAPSARLMALRAQAAPTDAGARLGGVP